jgi:hypothetical protein
MKKVSAYANNKSLLLFFKSIFFLRIGAVVGCAMKERAKAPATVEKSELNNSLDVK